MAVVECEAGQQWTKGREEEDQEICSDVEIRLD